MKLLGKDVLADFVSKHADARKAVAGLTQEIEAARWQNPHDVQARYPRASLLGDRKVVLDIRGNRYRILLQISYQRGIAVVLKAGTHAEYDTWDIN